MLQFDVILTERFILNTKDDLKILAELSILTPSLCTNGGFWVDSCPSEHIFLNLLSEQGIAVTYR